MAGKKLDWTAYDHMQR